MSHSYYILIILTLDDGLCCGWGRTNGCYGFLIAEVGNSITNCFLWRGCRGCRGDRYGGGIYLVVMAFDTRSREFNYHCLPLEWSDVKPSMRNHCCAIGISSTTKIHSWRSHVCSLIPRLNQMVWEPDWPISPKKIFQLQVLC